MKLFLTLIILGWLLLSCSSPQNLSVTIRDFSTCKGWDENGKPLEATKVFSTHEKKIFACGRIETNQSQSIALPVNWASQRGLIFREILDVKGPYFYSVLEPKDATFAAGDYTVEVVVGRSAIYEAKFKVKEIP